MKRMTDIKTHIGIWNAALINVNTARYNDDTNINILQIEPGSSPDSYIVEYMVKEKEDNNAED